jgi:hypothetical protein
MHTHQKSSDHLVASFDMDIGKNMFHFVGLDQLWRHRAAD